MRCDNFETRLNEVLDQRGLPGEDRELRAHAEGCGNCRDLLAGQQALFTGLELADPPHMSSGFTGRVLACLAETSDTDSLSGATAGIVAPAGAISGMNRIAWWTGGIVAAAIVAVVVGWEPISSLFLPGQLGNDPVQPLATNPPEVAPEKKIVPAPPVVAPSPKPEIVVKQPEAAPRVATADEQFGRLLEAVQTLPTEEGSEFASQVVDGLRPIAEPMNSVLNVVRRGLLGGEAEMMQEAPPGKPQAGSSLATESTNLS